MNKQKKAKKPARIKGEVIPVFANPEVDDGTPPVKHLLLPIDNPDALVEQVAMALNDEYWKDFLGEPDDETLARAALRSIGVPIKKGLIK
jgi:hypothetical protein